MKKIILFLFLTCLLLPARTQELALKHLYRISAAQARQLYQSEESLNPALFNRLVDVVPRDSIFWDLFPGHYLIVSADGEQLELEQRSVNHFSVVMLNNERDLAFRVIDSTGRALPDLEARFRKKQVPYDDVTGTYRLRKWNKGGLLEIRSLGDTAFFDIDAESRKSMFARRYRRFSSRGWGYVLTTPIRWGEGVVNYFRRGFGYGDWGLRLFPKRIKKLMGYIALSQPRYRPGDTLRVKVHLADHRGRPWEEEARLTCSFFEENYRRKVVIDTLLGPEQPGVFVYEFAPPSDWPLDERYTIDLDIEEKHFYEGLSQSFQYEDYQLDAIQYSLISVREQYATGEPIVLEATARDFNGLPVPDAFIRLVLLTGSVESFYEDEMLIPDTLWRHEQALAAGGPTRITIPDSLLPAAEMEVEVKAFFVNSNGELQEKAADFSYDATPRRLEVRLEDGDVIAEAFENGKAVQREAALEVSAPGNDFLEPRRIQLPYRERLNPNLNEYWFSCGEELVDITLSENDASFASGIRMEGFMRADSVFIEAVNPHRIPVLFFIQTKDSEVASGQFETERWSWRNPAEAQAYFVRLQYIWGGEGHSRELTVRRYDKQLDIQLEIPARVTPGEQAIVNAKATDVKGRPAAGVDLVLATLNNQFGDPAPFSGPDISYRPLPAPLTYNRFHAYSEDRASHQMPLSKKWIDALDVGGELFYQVRYPERGLLLHSDTVRGDTVYRHWAQFAPFLVRDGKVQPLYLIYCNGELLYYHGARNQTPYSFAGRSGENSIVLRGREYEYTLEGVRLEKGRKLILSIDEARFGEAPPGISIRRRAVPDRLTEQEQRLLRQSILVLRRESLQQPVFLRQPGGRIHRLDKGYGSGKVMAGPFALNTPLYFVAQGAFVKRLTFEPGYEYVVQKHRDKLYAASLFEESPVLPKKLPAPPVDDLLLLPSRVDMHGPPKQQLAFQSKYLDQQPGKGAFECLYAPGMKEPWPLPFGAVFVSDSGDTLAYEARFPNARFVNLPAGRCRFYLFYSSGNYLERDIHIRSDTLLFLNLIEEKWISDTSRTLLEQFFFEPPEELSATEPSIGVNLGINPFRENGRLITGRVLGDDGEPLIGVTVLIAGTQTGTVTDFDGNFSLWTPSGKSELIFRYAGYEAERREVSEENRYLEIDMDFTEASLDEVLVVGYSVAVRGLTSTRAAVNELQGRVAGVEISLDENSLENLSLLPEPENGLPVQGKRSQEGLRGDFRDLAAWHPYVFTDEAGKASFPIHFPDNITQWKTFALGMDEQGRGGLATAYTRAFKEVMAQLELPRFLVEGDRADIIGKALNYTNDTLQVRTSFAQEGLENRPIENALGRVLVETLPLEAPDGIDSLTLSYRLESHEHRDGEERKLPVFPRGVEEYEGHFAVLRGDTSLRFSFDPALGPVTLHVRDNVLDLLLEDLDRVQTYPYHCNEQTASRLLAFLAEKEVRRQLGQPFEEERELRRTLARLRKAQRDDGGWGWWPGNPPDTWMTAYVIRALQRAEKAGYPVPGLPAGIRYLENRLHQIKPKELLLVLDLFAGAEDRGLLSATETTLQSIDKLDLSLHERLLTLRVRQAYGIPYELDSLYHYRQSTTIGGHYWPGDEQDWQSNSLTNTLLAYEILRSAGREAELEHIQQYLLSQRRSTGWGNTYVSARILRTLLPDLLGSAGEVVRTQVSLEGAISTTVLDLPFETTFDPSEELDLRKTGPLPVFLTAYQQFQNRDPALRDSLYRIETYLRQEGQATTELSKGRPAELIVDITTGLLTDYAMIEVPIPAGCSYFKKATNPSGPEVHREFLREKVAIFCRTLPPGEHRFVIELEPRFSGRYTLNPAVVRPMYFPGRDGRNAMKAVRVW